MNYERLARGLGWFSIGIGVSEIFATGPLAKALRMEDSKRLLRGFDFREIAAGVGILTQARRGPWLWARVAGDVMDLTALGSSVARARVKTGPLAAAAAVAGVTALDVLCSQRLSARHV